MGTQLAIPLLTSDNPWTWALGGPLGIHAVPRSEPSPLRSVQGPGPGEPTHPCVTREGRDPLPNPISVEN